MELIDYIQGMHMSYSYKPVLLLALIAHDGKVTVDEASDYFISFYRNRIIYGLTAEKKDSIFCRLNPERKDVETNIITNPIAALMNSGLFEYSNRTLVTKNPLINKPALEKACYNRLDNYYKRIGTIPAIRCFHKPEEPDGYLSNWFLSDFTVHGTTFTSAEQYIMHYKAMLFDDTYIAHEIMKTNDVAKIQQLGRVVSNYNERIWNGNRQIVAYKGILAKFSQSQALRNQLISTGNDILAECALSDKVWGIGVSLYDKNRFNMDFWQGQNLLGYTLCRVRNDLLFNA